MLLKNYFKQYFETLMNLLFFIRINKILGIFRKKFNLFKIKYYYLLCEYYTQKKEYIILKHITLIGTSTEREPCLNARAFNFFK